MTSKRLDGRTALRQTMRGVEVSVENYKRVVGGGVEYQMLRTVGEGQVYGFAVRCAYQNGRASAAQELARARELLAMALAKHRQHFSTGQTAGD